MSVSALIGVSLTVADLGTAAAFFRDALGLPPGSETRVDDPARVRLLGLAPGTTIRTVDIAAGRQAITLSAFDPPGHPYPSARASNDPWFEHVALVCGDIDVVHMVLDTFNLKALTWLTLAGITGRIVCDLVNGDTPPIDLSPLRPNRY